MQQQEQALAAAASQVRSVIARCTAVLITTCQQVLLQQQEQTWAAAASQVRSVIAGCTAVASITHTRLPWHVCLHLSVIIIELCLPSLHCTAGCLTLRSEMRSAARSQPTERRYA